MADTDSEPQVPAEDEEHSSHDSESGESEDSDESSEGSDMDVMEEACERGRETHPRVITSSWHIQLAYAAKKGECSWRSRIPQYQMERLREAGWSGKCYLRLDGLVESFEDKLCFPTVGKHEKGATIVAYAMPLFQERFLPLWIKSPSAISSWISYVKKNDRGVNATHAEVRSLDCPFKHGPERLKWLQQIFAEQQYGGGGKCEWGYKRVTHCSMTVGDIFIMGELVYPSAFDGFWVVNLNGHSECVRVEDTFGATLEEKASGSGDVRTDLQEALAASVAVAPEPVPKPKPKKMPGKGGFMSYDPPRLIRDAPINQDVKGGKGGKGEQEKGDGKGKGSNATVNVANDAVAAEAQLNLDVKGGKGEKEKGGGKGKGSNATGNVANDALAAEAQLNLDVKGGKGEKEKGGGKGKGSNATGNVTNDAVAAEAQLNLDVKGGKGEKEKGGGKGRAKGEGKKGGKDSAAKGNWEKGYGKGKAKGKGKKDSNGHGKGANSPEHQQVMPEAQFNVDVPGGKGAWEKGYGKGRAKGKGKKGSNGKGANNAGHKDFTDVKGGKGYRNKGHGKGNAKGKGKKGGNGHGKGANDAEHQHMMPEAQFNLDVSGGKGERVKGNGKGKAKGKGKKGGKDFQAKGDWDKGYGKGSPKGNGKKGGKDFQAKGGWDKGYGKANAKGKGKKGFEQNIYM